MEPNRKQTIQKLKAILAGSLTVKEAFPEQLDLKICSNEELNLLLRLKKASAKGEAIAEADKELIKKFKLDYEQRKKAIKAAKDQIAS